MFETAWKMKKRFLRLNLAIGLLLLGVAVARAQTAPNACHDEKMQRRIESARDILSEADKFRARAEAFHKRAEFQIAEAKKLKGKAEILQTRIPAVPGTLKLNGAQLEAAKSQYAADLKEFAAHARAYNLHLRQFQQTVGECHASNVTLNNVLRKYDLHLEQFHIPDLAARIRPPHICGELAETLGAETESIASRIMHDQLRVIDAEQRLRVAEQKLQVAEAVAPSIQDKAVNASIRAQSEQQLMAEFGRLRQEYDLLKMANQRLAGTMTGTGKLARTSVAGKIQK